ncbi:hypothetical protein DPX16_17901 [Anabarilius grahami]|uniref:Uncharacterized protein n=1 Tax=Anabarilius grahami TaxID=495550 RepID=A0A3N0YHF2_ANAGA|nr:hypothetical protein DPX16_17901 [Anabarilius grahami]
MPQLISCSPSPSPMMSCGIVKPQAVHSLALPKTEDPMPLPPVADPFAPPRPVDLSAPPWILPPSAPPEILGLADPPGSLIPLASPRSAVTLSALRMYEPTVALLLSTPSAPVGSALPPAPPGSSVAPAPPVLGCSGYTSEDRYCSSALVSSAICVLGSLYIGSISIGCPPEVAFQVSLLAPTPSTPPWAIIMAELWVITTCPPGFFLHHRLGLSCLLLPALRHLISSALRWLLAMARGHAFRQGAHCHSTILFGRCFHLFFGFMDF